MKHKARKNIYFLADTCNESEGRLFREPVVDRPDGDARIRLRELLWCCERKQLAPRDLDRLWDDLKKRIEAPPRSESVARGVCRSPRFSIVHGAMVRRFAFAFLLLLAGASFVFRDRLAAWWPLMRAEAVYRTVTVEHGSRLSFRLADNTMIIADAGSTIRYPSSFSGKREIFLTGEAYFDVAHDPEHPFYVHAHHALVTVRGTRFNVRAWNENPRVTICVDDGRVVLSQALNRAEQDSIVLSRNETGFVLPDGPPVKEEIPSPQNPMGWMKNEIHFENATVAEVLAQLGRWYQYEFVLEDSSILKQHLTVHILPTNVEDVLEVVSLLTGTRIEKESNCIRIEK